MTKKESSHEHNLRQRQFDFRLEHQGSITTNYAYVIYLPFATYFSNHLFPAMKLILAMHLYTRSTYCKSF